MTENKRLVLADASDLERVLSSPVFTRSERLSRLLRVLGERTLQNPAEPRLKEVEIGVMLYGRRADYDPKLDSIVRVEATRLRKRLKDYYDGPGVGDPLRLVVPPGRYEVEFHQVELVPETPAVPHPAPPSGFRWKFGLSLTCLAATVLLVLLYGRAGETPVNILPLTSYPGVEEHPAISPDGRRVTFIWDGEDGPALYVQQVGQESPLRMTHATAPEFESAWSPDGKQIAFLRAGADQDSLELRRIDFPPSSVGETLIGTVRVVSSTTPGLSWSPDGEWLATADRTANGMELVLFSVKTGEKKPFWTTGRPGWRLRPEFSPNGRYLAYIRSQDVAVGDVFLSQLPSGPEREITHDRAVVSGIAWTPDSRALIVASQRTPGWSSLWHVGLDGAGFRRLTESGVDSVQPSFARRGGRLVFSRRTDDINIWRVKADGSAPPVEWIASNALDSAPQYSPDGTRIAFRTSRTGTSEIWVAAADGRALRRLTNFNSKVTGSPQWSPDGRWLAFDSRASGNADVYLIPAGGGVPRNLTASPANEYVPTWSRDGKWIYFTSDRNGAASLWRQPAGGGSAEFVRPVGIRATESPDGRFLYFAHGNHEAGLFRAPRGGGPEELVLPALKPEMWGSWALSGNAIYYIDIRGESGRPITQLLRFDLVTREERPVSTVKQAVRFDSALGVSPDGNWVLFSQLDRSGSDIFLVENTR